MLSPVDGSRVAVVHRAGPEQIESAIAHAAASFQMTRHLPVWKRSEALEAIRAGIRERREELAQVVALEAGKPIAAAGLPVRRPVVRVGAARPRSRGRLRRLP